MKKFLLILVSLLLVSCQFFDKKVPVQDVLLQQELKKINWNQVDEYPSMAICDSIIDKEQQKLCFIETILEQISSRIEIDSLKLQFPELDTLHLKITVNPDATVLFESQKSQDSIGFKNPTLDSILNRKLHYFPKVEPAIKKGIKVKTEFVVPIIINSK